MTIHQKITFKCSPATIYDALTISGDFAAVTDTPADISGVDGDAFSCFGGLITGRNIELVKNEMIVQAWRVSAWPAGVYSIVRITLAQQGDDTELTLDQSGYPEDAADHLDSGWHKKYWEPLKSYCE